jgi:hypothetical protein
MRIAPILSWKEWRQQPGLLSKKGFKNWGKIGVKVVQKTIDQGRSFWYCFYRYP